MHWDCWSKSIETADQRVCTEHVVLLFSSHPTIYCWFIFEKANEVKEVKRRGEKNIKNKSVQTKLNSYIKKYIKKETLQIFWYSLLNIPLCVCVYVRN